MKLIWCSLIAVLMVVQVQAAQITIDDIPNNPRLIDMMQDTDANFTELYDKWVALGADYDTAAELAALFAGKQGFDDDLTVYAGITPSANVQSILSAADYAALRTLLDLETGVDFYSVEEVNAALAALEVDDLNTLSGVAKGVTHLGVFSGSTIPDNQNNKAALQALETAIEGAAGGHDAVTIGTGNGLTLDGQTLSLAGATNSTPGAMTAAQVTAQEANTAQLAGTEVGATADQTDAEIATAYGNQVPQVSGAEITAGTETAVRRVSPADVKGMIDTHATGAAADDTPYDATTWNDNTDAATKNAIRDKIESLTGGHDAVTLGAGVNAVTLTGQEIGSDAAVEELADLTPVNNSSIGFDATGHLTTQESLVIDTNGFLARTGDGAAASRTHTGSSTITVADGDGVAGNPTYSITDGSIGASQLVEADVEALIFDTDNTYNMVTTGTIQGKAKFNSYTSDQTLTFAENGGGVVQFTVAGECTVWDAEAVNIGDFFIVWARDAEKIELVPASGDHFVLFDGTALTADYEADIPATAGTKITLMCTADDTWAVYSETAPVTDGGVAD